MSDQQDAKADAIPAAPPGGNNPQPSRTRRSDRLPINLAVQVSGTDGFGQFFMEDTQTAMVSRHGAKILLDRSLVPELEVMVSCAKTGLESEARVVGQMGKGPGGYYYGVEFLNLDINVWGIEFPPLTESEKAVARALLECRHCHTQEVVYLNEFDAEVFEANNSLSRRCKRCNDTTLWKRVPVDALTSTEAPAVAPIRTQNERKDIRVSLKMLACVRGEMLHGDEVVITENVSHGGLRFKSAKFFSLGSSVEVAVPFDHRSTNIFTLGQISHAEYLPSEGLTLYGVAYVQKGWPRKE